MSHVSRAWNTFLALLLFLVLASSCANHESRPTPIPAPPSAPLVVRVGPSKLPNACCADATCDRVAFAKLGGICPSDPRIKGPLPARAVPAQTK
jgi:hypothetical protein